MGEALDTAQRFFKVFADGDMETADTLFADDCVIIMPTGTLTKPEHRMMGEAFRAALPDSRMEIDHVIDAGDEVFIEGRFVGTHTGDMQSPGGTIPASGNKIDLRFADYFKVSGGRITHHRTYWDQVTLITQLGSVT